MTKITNILISPRTGLPLKLDDTGSKLVAEDNSESWPIINGVFDFVGNTEDQFGQSVRKKNWVEQNWKNAKSQLPSWQQRIGNEITEANGIILEIAAGPGGGNVPAILLSNSSAKIIMNDISRTILEDWKKVFEQEMTGQNVSFAAFDACVIPVDSNSIEIVSSCGGISHVTGRSQGIEEIYRVLKPSGYLYSVDLHINNDDWMHLPEDFRAKTEIQIPAVIKGFHKILPDYGFIIVRNELLAYKVLDPADSDLANSAQEYGVKLGGSVNLVVAMKA